MNIQEEFEAWVGNPYILEKKDSPKLWGGDDTLYHSNPYEHPWTVGAYEAWKYFKGGENEPK